MTTTTQHTPGPWTVRRDVLNRELFDVLAPNDDAGKQGVSYSGEHLMVAHQLDSEADARLIAAAPEMVTALAALTEAATYPWDHEPLTTALDTARALLAKIEGKG